MDAYEKHLVLKAIALLAGNLASTEIRNGRPEFLYKFVNHLYKAGYTKEFDTDFEITSAINMCMNDSGMVEWISKNQFSPVRDILSALNKLFEVLGYQTYTS